MARKSLAALAVVPLTPRPEAPADLTPDEAQVWKDTVATKPADWFTKDTHPLLVGYCRTVLRARNVAALIRQAEQEMPGLAGAALLERLYDMEGKLNRTLCTLATKMRLSQQSKYGARGAETAARAAAEPVKPWEFAKHG